MIFTQSGCTASRFALGLMLTRGGAEGNRACQSLSRSTGGRNTVCQDAFFSFFFLLFILMDSCFTSHLSYSDISLFLEQKYLLRFQVIESDVNNKGAFFFFNEDWCIEILYLFPQISTSHMKELSNYFFICQVLLLLSLLLFNHMGIFLSYHLPLFEVSLFLKQKCLLGFQVIV